MRVAPALSALAALLVVTAPPARAAEAAKDAAPKAKAPSGPAAAQLERVKSLAGTWAGKAAHGGGSPTDTTVEWRVTGGGSAVLEILMPGTPHEMTTLYHLDGDQLLLTHYCATGNQPTMRAAPSKDPSTIAFDFVRGSNMKPTDMHMHAMKLTFVDADHVKAEWTSWKDGKAAGGVTMDLARQR